MTNADDDRAPSSSEPAPAVVKVPENIVPIRRIKRDFQAAMDAALLKVSKGEFTNDQIEGAIAGVLKDVDLNKYKPEVVSKLAQVERESRHAAFSRAVRSYLAWQFELFTEDLARRIWIPLGEGKEVCLADATWAHLQHKRLEQRKNTDEVVAAMRQTDAFCDELEPTLSKDPNRTVRDVMYDAGKWLRPKPAANG